MDFDPTNIEKTRTLSAAKEHDPTRSTSLLRLMTQAHFWNTSRRTLTWGTRPLIMGIIQISTNPPSGAEVFYRPEDAVLRAMEMEQEGANIIDLSADNPMGADSISAEEELKRIAPVVERLASSLQIPISIETTKAVVARKALECGAEIINDYSGGDWDKTLWPAIAELRAGYVLTHCPLLSSGNATPVEYKDVVNDIARYLHQRMAEAHKIGIVSDRIAMDLGFGIGKKLEHNLAMLANIGSFRSVSRPIVMNVSRRNFLKLLAGEENNDAACLAAQAWASFQGASIWRVHDVKAAVAAARLIGSVLGAA
jgi:dihydropteroate synthase